MAYYFACLQVYSSLFLVKVEEIAPKIGVRNMPSPENCSGQTGHAPRINWTNPDVFTLLSLWRTKGHGVFFSALPALGWKEGIGTSLKRSTVFGQSSDVPCKMGNVTGAGSMLVLPGVFESGLIFLKGDEPSTNIWKPPRIYYHRCPISTRASLDDHARLIFIDFYH